MQKYKKMIALVAFVTLLLGGFSAVAMAANTGKVNINTATVEELVQLDRIGTQYAQRIVAYREANGPFASPQDILNVKGIGPKTWEANKDRISVK